jgi:two-component system, NarL family, response regulator LiaR
MTTTEANVYILTDRQHKILVRLANGESSREIAEEMHFCERTIKHEISLMLIVFGARNRTQMAAKALREGVIE